MHGGLSIRFVELYHPTPAIAALWCQTEGAYSGSCEVASVTDIHDGYAISTVNIIRRKISCMNQPAPASRLDLCIIPRSTGEGTATIVG
jgi:hypothetical protein